MKNVLIVGFLVVLTGTAFATEVREFVKIRNGDVAKMANSIVADLFKEDFNSGFAKLKMVMIGMTENDLNKFQLTWVQQNESIKRIYGSAIGLDLIAEYNVADSYVRLDYLIRHERGAIHIVLVFYRTPAGWGVTSINFDDKVNELFPLRTLPDVVRIETVPDGLTPTL